MASKEKVKKKKQAPSPMVGKRNKQQKVQDETTNEPVEEMHGSQVSVRSAANENIKDFTEQEPDTLTMEPVPSSSDPQTSVSTGKKKKKDHVDEKLKVKGKHKESKESPQKQPASILKQPDPKTVTGSAVSLRSNISRVSKEAWVENNQNEEREQESTDGQMKVPSTSGNTKHSSGAGKFKLSRDNKVAPEEATGVERIQTGTPSNSVISLRDNKSTVVSKQDGLKGIKVDVEEDSPEKHAYVPYLYARNCIAKIMEDMKSMKQNHVLIVENIQTHYGDIESETQEQFNMFVLCMREEYSNKKTMFRQVIDAHKVELDKKEKYWNEMLQSLAERNNRLLKEKKMLLVHSKTEIEKLEKEKDSPFIHGQDTPNKQTHLNQGAQQVSVSDQSKQNTEAPKPVAKKVSTTNQGQKNVQLNDQGTQTTIGLDMVPSNNASPADAQSPNTTPVTNNVVPSKQVPGHNLNQAVHSGKQSTQSPANAQSPNITPVTDNVVPGTQSSGHNVSPAVPGDKQSTQSRPATGQSSGNPALMTWQSIPQSDTSIPQNKHTTPLHSQHAVTNQPVQPQPGDLQEQLGMVPTPVPMPVGAPQAWEEERKVLQDQLQTEKATVASLKNQLANMDTGSGSPVKVEIATTETKANSAMAAGAGFGAGALATAGVMAATKENNKQMEKERHEMDEERKRLAEERAKFDEERQDYAREQEKWLNEITNLQTQLAEQSVSGNEWKVKHDILHGRLEEVAGIQAKYQMLESQYAALALLVKDSDTSAALNEHMAQTAEEKKMMTTEKVKLDADIDKFEKTFEKKNGRKPTDDDKSDSVKEMYTTREEVSFMVTSLEQKEATFKQVEGGKVPDPPEIPNKPVDTTVPEVVTVQVKVPDPAIVEELKLTKTEFITVQTEISRLHQLITELRTEISTQNQQLAKQRETIAGLEHQVAAMKAEGVAAGAGVVGNSNISDEELDALKKENRELRRDMKKMIKQYERLAARQSSEGDGEDSNKHMKDMAEALSQQDGKIADLEAELETLREEKLILKEKVRTITETITVTHFEENKKNSEEKDQRIEELLAELAALREEHVSMTKDMKKMVKTHAKTKHRLDELLSAEKAVKLLEIVAMLVHEVHSEVPDAASQINVRLDEAQGHVGQSKDVLDRKQAAYQAWVDEYQKKHSKLPGKEDRDKLGTTLHEEWDKAKQDFKTKHLYMSALLLMKTGDVSGAVEQGDDTDKRYEIQLANMEKALSTADNQIIDLEAKTQNLTDEKNRYKNKADELEKTIFDMQKQAELNAALLADSQSSAELTEQVSLMQKRGDSLEAELMQERMSHVNTRDEMETLRKQMDVLKEEYDNERQGMEDRINGAKAGLEAQLDIKDEELKALKAKNGTLEAEKLSKLPPDAAAEVKKLQDQLRELEENQSSSKNSTAAMTAQVADLTSKLEVASKNLETQRAANRELESKVKQGRHDKEKETKRMSRHIEEKQQKTASEDKQRITMLVKRVKELEAKAGKGTSVVPVPVGGSDKGAETLMLKREIKDQAAEIKRLEKELKFAGGAAGGSMKDSVADKKKSAQHEKILKELEKRMEYEKEKSSKLVEGLKAADEENKTLAKELDDKNRTLAKLTAEMKTISMAAKEGIEAAAKVKDLETENKRLGDENVVLTKNFESERVLRKKYYNMVEDMKGKIRVYCRARPMSKSELDRGNKPVCKSADEYSISVETQRGLKEFQYDQVFMEHSTQEKIFEDTNNLIQSAVDGYNVCIFAYGQTGSGKTFTMIGDRDQNFPGIAPRAFNRIFELAGELKNKFTIKIETYMLELYNDKLIDLFAKPGTSDDEKLEIKKDKKGMVFVQGSVVKPAKNAKELFALFEEGSMNRHTASTKMNAESSRSHLVVGVVMEAINKNTGNVTKGKLSLVDLAGSERVGKTGAGAEQLKEAMSINKSLSALGDVISALSSDQQFIPYRNNKLTMLMQDSLGGNAKTLMFVNISPADYNMDETVISLTYASRVKLITNDASKNADNKEIARLKTIIEKLKQGEAVQEEEI